MLLSKWWPIVIIIVNLSHQENEAPVVKIVSPSPETIYKWDTQVRYEIEVSDKEDGNTKYDEINTKEVLLQVHVAGDDENRSAADRKPLQAMMASNCMQCHDFNSKLIGPSFQAISEKYNEQDVSKLLVKHVREGSKGVWGDIIMPTHPELSIEETRVMVDWILSYSKQKNVTYFTGTDGVLRIKKPENYKDKSSIILTAAYLDHGKKTGEDEMRIKIENGK